MDDTVSVLPGCAEIVELHEISSFPGASKIVLPLISALGFLVSPAVASDCGHFY